MKHFLLLILLCVIGCAQSQGLEDYSDLGLPPNLTTFKLFYFTPQEQDIIKSALEEFDENLIISDNGESNIIAADISSSGLTYTTDTYSNILVRQSYREMDDWLSSRLRKIVLHEVGHHIANFRCGKKFSGHIEAGNIMSASPELQSENLTARDFAYINCEIDPNTMTSGKLTTK